ncbi:unnamed protein product [Meganyctiphanes norvegica]|uniref:Uncharacterized protein n=1 Tax=Meganyctiphanes norvegica TaxID=48144 RepID=A0AAV2PMP1_MEGNR
MGTLIWVRTYIWYGRHMAIITVSIKGGSFFFRTITFEITYDQCTIMVCTIFEVILGLLGKKKIGAIGGGGGRPPVRKFQQSPEIIIIGGFWIDIGFLIVTVQSFLLIHKKFTELWPFK